MIGGDTNDINQVVNQVNQNIAELKTQDITNITKDDTGTRRVLLGKGKDGFYGLKVSQPGVDVYEGSDSQMAFNSDNNVFKIVDTGVATLDKAASSTGTTATVNNPYGIDAAVVAFYTDQVGTYNSAMPGLAITTAGLVAYRITFEVKSSTIVFYVDTPNIAGSAFYGGAYTFTIRYYILQETAN